MEREIFKGLEDADKRFSHFYYGGDELYNLPYTKAGKQFDGVPIAFFLDKNCKIVEFEYYPSYSNELLKKGKKINDAVFD